MLKCLRSKIKCVAIKFIWFFYSSANISINNRSVEMAKKYNVELEVLSSLVREPGTIVREVAKMEKMLIRGVTKDTDVARISVCSIEDTPGKAFRIFSLLAKHNVNVDIILQSIGRDNTKDISFTVAEGDCDEALKLLQGENNTLHYEDIKWSKDVSKVSIVGAGMESNPGVAAKMFEALFESDINIQMIATSEIKISVLIDVADADKAVAAIHNAFIPELG